MRSSLRSLLGDQSLRLRGLVGRRVIKGILVLLVVMVATELMGWMVAMVLMGVLVFLAAMG
jgi:hypothetical protein